MECERVYESQGLCLVYTLNREISIYTQIVERYKEWLWLLLSFINIYNTDRETNTEAENENE